MKKLSILILCVFILSCGASRYFYIEPNNVQKPSMKHYNIVCLGWMPMKESDWKRYGYPNKEDWNDFIKELNTEALPKYLQEFLPERKIIGPTDPGNPIPANCELFIKFNSYDSPVKYQEECMIDSEFIDIKANKVIYSANVIIYKGSKEHRDFSFNGRYWSLFYWIDNFLYYQLKD
jgi:hypothetical protein